MHRVGGPTLSKETHNKYNKFEATSIYLNFICSISTPTKLFQKAIIYISPITDYIMMYMTRAKYSPENKCGLNDIVP